MTKSLMYAASDGTYEEFMEVYTPNDALQRPELLLEALGNFDPDSRLAIVGCLLDDGADASYVDEDGMNALHVLLSDHFTDDERNFPEEAKLLRRLLDGGADIHQFHKKYGTPLTLMCEGQLIANDKHGVADAKPFWDVLFERDDLNFEKLVNRKGAPKLTLREMIFDDEKVWNAVEFRKALLAYEAKQSS